MYKPPPKEKKEDEEEEEAPAEEEPAEPTSSGGGGEGSSADPEELAFEEKLSALREKKAKAAEDEDPQLRFIHLHQLFIIQYTFV